MRLAFILCALFIHLTLHSAFSEGHLSAKLPVVKGRVLVKVQGKEELQRAHKGRELRIGSAVVTVDNALAQVEFPGGAFVNIGENSQVRANHYSFNPETFKRRVILRQLSGTARYIVPSKSSEGSSLMVETDSAIITARTADFLLRTINGKTELFVIDGVVNIRNSSSLVVGDLAIRSFKSTAVIKGVAPEQSRNFFMKDLIELKALTDVYGASIE